MDPIRDLLALIGLGKRSPEQVASSTFLHVLAVIVGAVGVAFMLLALHQSLTPVVGHAFASLYTGIACLLAAAALLLLGAWVARPPQESNERSPVPRNDPATMLATWTRENPREAAVAAAVLGACLGAFPELRESMIRMASEALSSSRKE